MGLKISFNENGSEYLSLGDQVSDLYEIKKDIVISGEQRKIHEYLEKISSVRNAPKYHIVYEMLAESRIVPPLGFVDADVKLVFFNNQFVKMTRDEFKKLYITPYMDLFDNSI